MFDAAYGQALRRLRTRDRFVAEVRSRLAESFDVATQDAVIGRLITRGLLDDTRLVRTLVAANQGKRAVSIDELRRRCLERGAGEAALEALANEADPPMETILRRFEATDSGRARAYRYLTLRGFDEGEILAAIANYLS